MRLILPTKGQLTSPDTGIVLNRAHLNSMDAYENTNESTTTNKSTSSLRIAIHGYNRTSTLE